MTDGDWAELATPALMRSARGAYAQSVRAQLHAIGIDDLPRNGAFILAGIDTAGGPRQDLPSELGVTKQAVSQVIDLLVSRGYLDREPDPDDRRRVRLELTHRGEDVVAAVLRGVEAVDRQLEEAVSPEQVGAMRSVLSALAGIKQTDIATGAGRARPARQLRRFSPIFNVRDLRAALAHYATLGFSIDPPTKKATTTASRTGTESACTWPLTPSPTRSGPPRRTSTCATPTRCTRNGASPGSPATPTLPSRRLTGCARAHTPTRMAT